MTGMPACLDHINGSKLKFTIKPGIQNGQIVRLAGKGMPNPETDRYGDLLVRCSVVTPELDEKQIESLKHLLTRTDVKL